MYTHSLNPPSNTALCPSRLFGGPERRYVPNIVLPAGDHGNVWRPIDGIVGNANLGPMYVPPHVVRSLYVSRDIHAVCVLTLAWDTPEVVYVSGGMFTPGWHECRLVTDAILADLRERFAAFQASGAADDWAAAAAATKVRVLLATAAEAWPNGPEVTAADMAGFNTVSSAAPCVVQSSG